MQRFRAQLCRPSRRFAALLALASLGATGCRTLALPGLPVFEFHAVEPAPLSAQTEHDGVRPAVWCTETLSSHGTIELVRAQSGDADPFCLDAPARLSLSSDDE